MLTKRCGEPLRLSRPLLPTAALPLPRRGRASLHKVEAIKLMRLVILALGLILIAGISSAEDQRMARYDCNRVYTKYLRTEELSVVVSYMRNTGGPGSTTPGVEQLIARQQQFDDIVVKVKQAIEGTPERERLENAQKIAALELQLAQIHRADELHERAVALSADFRRKQANIIQDIAAEAKLLASEKSYILVVPDNLPPDDFHTVINGASLEDVTDELISRLNAKYRKVSH
jgi:hypothetical protein